MKIYDIILGMYIFNLVSNLFNATIFSDTMLPTQGLDSSEINATITDYQNLVGSTKEQGFLDSLWSGSVLTAQSIGFILKLFLSAFGFASLLTAFGVHPLLVTVFSGAMNIVLVFCVFMLIFNRNSKWME